MQAITLILSPWILFNKACIARLFFFTLSLEPTRNQITVAMGGIRKGLQQNVKSRTEDYYSWI